MNCVLYVNLVVLALIIFARRVYSNKGVAIDEFCLPDEERPSWNRSLHYNNEPFVLSIEVSDRPSHWIINYIFEILVRERLGYNKIRFVHSNWDSTAETVSRVNCAKHGTCQRPPPVHVNLEVWLAPGENIASYASPSHVSYYGPLGPITRSGLFVHADSLQDWPSAGHEIIQRQTQHTNGTSQTASANRSRATPVAGVGGNYNGRLLYDYEDALKRLNALLDSDGSRLAVQPDFRTSDDISVHWSSARSSNGTIFPQQQQQRLILLHWYPSPLTLNDQLVRVGLPDCAGLRARNVSGQGDGSERNQACHFEVNQLVKVAWAKLGEAAPLIAKLVERMQILQSDYVQLLEEVDNYLNYTAAKLRGEERRFRAMYRETACLWLRMNRPTWKEWTPGWDMKKELVIGGMFTFYGKWVLSGLEKNAVSALDVLNGNPAYFADSEYVVKLQIRNVTCSQDVVLDDFYRFLAERDNSETMVGLIAGLCSDSIEAMVELANIRKVIVISPTVESARFLVHRQFNYFFRTVPSMSTASFILIRLFRLWGWRRIAMFRKDDHFFDRKAFEANDIKIVGDFEVEEAALTYTSAQKNLMTLKQNNGRIIIVEYFASATAIILCAAYHLEMSHKTGYVWFLNPWLSDKWWETPGILPPQCTGEQLAEMNSYSFTVGHQLHTGALADSRLKISQDTNDDQSARSLQARIYGQYTYESVMVLGSAVSRLLRKNPSALSALKTDQIAEEFRTLVSESDIGLSNESALQDLAALRLHQSHSTGQQQQQQPPESWSETRVEDFSSLRLSSRSSTTQASYSRFRRKRESPPQLRRVPRSAAAPLQDQDMDAPRPDLLSQLRFNSRNEREAHIWVLRQKKVSQIVPIIMWSTAALRGDLADAPAAAATARVASSPATGSEEEATNSRRDLASAYEQFANNLEQHQLDPPYWYPNGVRPGDGTITDADCAFGFLSRWLGVSCVVATWIFSAVMLACGLLPIFLLVVVFYRRKLKEAENLTRKPYEDLCAELADINMPSTDIVLNRRVGQGAFGLVYGGEAKRLGRWEAVAVKVITNKTTYEGKMDFLSEAKLMRGLDHKNVVRLVGICLHQQENDIYLVMELMLLGDLKTYLLARRVLAQSDPDHEDIRPSTLTNMAIDIAEGMAYLHNKRLIHRDIACRNCLVGRDRVVKIGDFGLTREAKSNSPDGYYRFTRNCELPIRWMSPEAVQFGIFSVKSDLWSYGIVLYEMITFGVFPYEGLCDVEVVERVKRMEFSITDFLPIAAKDTPVWRLIDSCCQHHWQHRPESMNQVIEALRANKDCIRPFLTDEPPKPNTTINALPFQPGAGACIMSEAPVTQPLAASAGLSLGRAGANVPVLHAEHVQNISRPWHGAGNFTDPVHVRSSSSSGGGSSNNGGGGVGAVCLHGGDTGPLCLGPSQRTSHSGSSLGVIVRQPTGSWTSARAAGRQGSYALPSKFGPAVPAHHTRINSTPSSDKVVSRVAVNGGRDYGVGALHQHPSANLGLRSSADFVTVADEDDVDDVRDFQANVSEPTSPLSAKDAVFPTAAAAAAAPCADVLDPDPQSWCSAPPPRSLDSDLQHCVSTPPSALPAPPSVAGRSELFSPRNSATADVAEEATALLASTNRSLSAEFLHFSDLVDDSTKPLHDDVGEDDDDSDDTPPTAATGRPLVATHHCTSCPLKPFLATSTSAEAAPPVASSYATGTASLLPVASKATSPASAMAAAASTNFFAMRVHQTRAEKARRMRRISNGAERALRRAVRVFTGGGGQGVSVTSWDHLDVEQQRSHWRRPTTKAAALTSKTTTSKPGGGGGGLSSKERLSASGCNESALHQLQHDYYLGELGGRMNHTCKSLPQVSAGCQSNCKLAANACRPTCGSAGDAHHLIKTSLTSPSGCFTHTFSSNQNGNIMTSVATTPVSAAATPPNPLSPGPTSFFLPFPPTPPPGGGGGRLTPSDLPGGPVSETTI